MTDWSRRTVLAALGLSPWLPACGGAGAGNKRDGTTAPSVASTRSVLREIVGSIRARFPFATGVAVIHQHRRAVVDAGETRHEAATRAEAWFTAVDADGVRRERRTTDLSADGLVRAADDLLGGGATADFGKPRTFAAKLDGDPRRTDRWTDRVGALFDRGRRRGGSRIVYRAAFLDVDDREVAFVGDGRDLLQRVVRARTGVAFVGAAGAAAHTAAAEAAGTAGLDALVIDDDALEAAADSALALLTARRPPSGEFDLILDPIAAAHLIGGCVAPALARELWDAGGSGAAALHDKPVGSEHVTLIDDPTLPGGFGSYFFDDDGRDAAPVTLVDRGVLAGSFAARRTPSNLYLAAGSVTGLDALMADVDAGLLLEGALAAYTDAGHWSVGLRAARAREIANGKLTGRLYGPLVVLGRVPALLGAARGATDSVRHVAAGDRSIGAPHLLTRATVAA